MKTALAIITLFLISTNLPAQTEIIEMVTPFDDALKSEIISNHELLTRSDSTKSLIIIFKDEFMDSAIASIKNNPQIKELILNHPTQNIINALAGMAFDNKLSLFLIDYNGSTLTIPTIERVSLLEVSSLNLETFDMSNLTPTGVTLLSVIAPQMTGITTASTYPNLELLNIYAPHLDTFPSFAMPYIYELVLTCSFQSLPTTLCDYKELHLISITNFAAIEIEPCIKALIQNGYYSNLLIYDAPGGNVIQEIRSKE